MAKRIKPSIVRSYTRAELRFLQGKPIGDFEPKKYFLPGEAQPANPHDHLPPISEVEPLRENDRGFKTIGEVLDEHDARQRAKVLGQLANVPKKLRTARLDNLELIEPEAPMDEDERMLIFSFFDKHPNATAVEIKRLKRAERSLKTPSRVQMTVRFEVWITFAGGHVITERGDTFDELIAIAERPAS